MGCGGRWGWWRSLLRVRGEGWGVKDGKELRGFYVGKMEILRDVNSASKCVADHFT